MNYRVDDSIVGAVENWVNHGLPPGSCTEYLLRGDYEEALLHAHVLTKPYWDDHVLWIECEVPEFCRGGNYDNWKGMEDYELRLSCKVDLGEDNEVFKL